MSSAPPLAPDRVEMVDLFAGPGGLDVAAHWLGIRTTGIEWDPNACATREAAGLSTKAADVQDCKPADYPEARFLAGGPPCQTYTVAGSGAGRRALDRVLRMVNELADGREIDERLNLFDVDLFDDERTVLVLQPLKWALEVCGRDEAYQAIVLEQVPTVLPVWEAMGAVLEQRGYEVDTGILHTEQYGVPQTRRRAILIARLGAPARLPEPTHRKYRKGMPQEYGDDALLPWHSMRDALGIHDQFIVVSNYGTGGDPKLRGRRSSSEPSATVTGKIRRNKVEWQDRTRPDRRVEPAEAGVLQTFPQDYPWAGNDLGQQIGNAIPPRLAAHVLAAAQGRTIDTEVLDRCVRLPWAETRHGVPGLLKPL